MLRNTLPELIAVQLNRLSRIQSDVVSAARMKQQLSAIMLAVLHTAGNHYVHNVGANIISVPGTTILSPST